MLCGTVNSCVVSFVTKLSILYLVILFKTSANANEILGCGGFIKSHVNLDFSKISILLLSKQGILKEKTECAPTNGYYFLPLYEKGDYRLKVQPPPGWSIEPPEVTLSVDGLTDPCSNGQDINFSFNGFGITGKVNTAGQVRGPKGVLVQLIDASGQVRSTETKENGDFHFTPVVPGKYSVKAQHSRWKLDPSSTVVQVSAGNTALPVGSLSVKGYDIRGSVTSDGKGIAGVYILLYSSNPDHIQLRVEGCSSALLPDVAGNPICHVVSDAKGDFTFGVVPAGSYSLVPLAKPPEQSKITFNIEPSKHNFVVTDDSLLLENVFEVTGFTISGRVLNYAGGKGMNGVRVLLDGQPIGLTDSQGYYVLKNMKSKTYTLKFESESCKFTETTVNLSPSRSVSLPDVWPVSWRVCGYVTHASEPIGMRVIHIQPEQPSQSQSIDVNSDPMNKGRWCAVLNPGVYLLSVAVSESERRDGLQYFPLTHKVTVSRAPVDDVIFSQLKAKLRGSVKCLDGRQKEDCMHVTVSLRSLSPEGSYVGLPQETKASGGSYVFSDILPGSYEVSVSPIRLCWSTHAHNVAVSSAEAIVPDFIQTGYTLTLQLTQPTEIHYSSGEKKGIINARDGITRHCLPIDGVYQLLPKGCHTFRPDKVEYSTKDPSKTVTIIAVEHSIGVRVLSLEEVTNAKLKVENENGEFQEELNIGKPLPQKENGLFVYQFTFKLATGAIILITPSSDLFLFKPNGRQTIIGQSECTLNALSFEARKGNIIQGSVVPPIDGVTVTLIGGDSVLKQITGQDGKYHFGPLDASIEYSLKAEKESYVITGPNDKGVITARKLAEIIVDVVDQNSGEPLQSCLVSVSGGSYRKNMATGNDGSLRFTSLAPDDYYVKPLMKEYLFKPPFTILTVNEGETKRVKMSGERVAISCSGTVAWAGGSGASGAEVSATPLEGEGENVAGGCAGEGARSSGPDGVFRLRGLRPGCSYRVRVRPDPERPHLRVSPLHFLIRVGSDMKDLDGYRFVIIEPLQVTDINVLVFTKLVDHYKTLKLTLTSELQPSSKLYSSKLDASGYAPEINPGIMLTMPRLPADNKSYILQVESSLSKATHTFTSDPIYFHSDGKYKYFSINFEPKVRTAEQDLNRTSILVLPLLGLLLLAVFNKEKVINVVADFAGTLTDKIVTMKMASQANQASTQSSQATLDDSQIDQIVQNINAVKKRPKPKKL